MFWRLLLEYSLFFCSLQNFLIRQEEKLSFHLSSSAFNSLPVFSCFWCTSWSYTCYNPYHKEAFCAVCWSSKTTCFWSWCFICQVLHFSEEEISHLSWSKCIKLLELFFLYLSMILLYPLVSLSHLAVLYSPLLCVSISWSRKLQKVLSSSVLSLLRADIWEFWSPVDFMYWAY